MYHLLYVSKTFQSRSLRPIPVLSPSIRMTPSQRAGQYRVRGGELPVQPSVPRMVQLVAVQFSDDITAMKFRRELTVWDAKVEFVYPKSCICDDFEDSSNLLSGAPSTPTLHFPTDFGSKV